MKSRLLPLLLVAFVPALASARVLTLSNNPQNPGQYSSYAAAEAAAVAGDTIYVHGSAISYNSITISKGITLIGPGHNPQKQAPLKAQFDYLSIGSSNVKVAGIICNYLLSSAGGLTNVTVSRNRIDYYMYLNSGNCNNWIIESNVLGYLYNGNSFTAQNNNFYNFYFENNVFNGHLADNWYAGTTYNLYFNNCVFLKKSGGQDYHAYYWKGATYNNCVFYGKNPTPAGSYSVTFFNCLSYGAANNGFPGTGSGNIENQDPLFTAYNGSGFAYADNYALQAGSPGKSAGLDGADLGLFGGTYLWNQYGMPKLPYISEFGISNNQVSAGGSLNINFKSSIAQ
ncbi:MAG: hypothetical protein EOO11_06225 [Chitinophagaceae bacterium]|nr:MAG: hypothetical protein EOO11_06225 [Chitinophagaceae bacterium]